MKTLLLAVIAFLSFHAAQAALPPAFADCMTGNNQNMAVGDLQEIAKVTRVTYCQNQFGITNKSDLQELLKNKNVQVAISLDKTTYTREDLLDLAKSGSFVVYVDSNRLAKEYLIDLSRAGIQLAIMSAGSNLSRTDLLDIAKAKPFIYNVNSAVLKSDLRDLVALGVQVVIRSTQSSLSSADIIELAKLNRDLVTVMP